jgi:hypothetical protein
MIWLPVHQRWSSTLVNRSNARHRSNISAQLCITPIFYLVKVFMRMITGIMWCSPIGISSVICAKILGVANLGRYAKNLILLQKKCKHKNLNKEKFILKNLPIKIFAYTVNSKIYKTLLLQCSESAGTLHSHCLLRSFHLPVHLSTGPSYFYTAIFEPTILFEPVFHSPPSLDHGYGTEETP